MPSAANTRDRAAGTPSAENVAVVAVPGSGVGAIAGEGVEASEARLLGRECEVRR